MEGAFAAALQARREARGLSLRELSARVRYSAGWLSRVAGGKGSPTLALARACDEALDAGGELLAIARAELSGGARPEQLPAAMALLVGRAEAVRDLDRALEQARAAGSALVVAVDGPPGVGKTSVALHWAHRVAGSFPEGVLHADLRGHSPQHDPADPGDVLGAFLTALRHESVPGSTDDRAALFRTAVAHRRLLVVLDNALDTAQVKPLLPGAPGSTVIVTSRRRLTGLSVTTGARRVSLAPMTPRESVELLRRVVGGDRVAAEPEAAAALAGRCSYLPLALRITAEQLATHRHRTLSGAEAELADGGLDVLADHDDPGLGVRRAFDLSYEALRPAVARTFHLLGLMPGHRLEAAAVSALVGEPPARTRRHLDELVAHHLIEETALDRYLLHGLLREYARERAESRETAADLRAAVGRLTAWYLHTADAAVAVLAPYRPPRPLPPPPDLVAPKTFRGTAAEFDATAWLDGCFAMALVRLAQLAGHHGLPTAWELTMHTEHWLVLRKPWDVWIAACRTGLEAACAHGSAADSTRMALALAEAYRQSGEHAASVRHAESALERASAAGDTSEAARACVSLGRAAADEGEPGVAYAHFGRALRRFRAAGDARGEAEALYELAYAAGLLGHVADAERDFDESLTLLRKAGDPYGEGLLWARRAGQAEGRGEQAAALDGFLRAAACHRGANAAWDEADALDSTARLLARLGRASDAIEAGRRARALFERLGDPRASTIGA